MTGDAFLKKTIQPRPKANGHIEDQSSVSGGGGGAYGSGFGLVGIFLGPGPFL